jgi:hypothetical protein
MTCVSNPRGSFLGCAAKPTQLPSCAERALHRYRDVVPVTFARILLRGSWPTLAVLRLQAAWKQLRCRSCSHAYVTVKSRLWFSAVSVVGCRAVHCLYSTRRNLCRPHHNPAGPLSHTLSEDFFSVNRIVVEAAGSAPASAYFRYNFIQQPNLYRSSASCQASLQTFFVARP